MKRTHRLTLVALIAALLLPTVALAAMESMPAYYDSMLFNINAKQMPASAATNVLAHNPGLHDLYFSNAVLPNGMKFVTVLSAKPGDDFNPLWRRMEIIFNAGVTPFQIFSDDRVDSAQAAGLITVRNTGLLFRCAVIGGAAKGGGKSHGVGVGAGRPATWGALHREYAN